MMALVGMMVRIYIKPPCVVSAVITPVAIAPTITPISTITMVTCVTIAATVTIAMASSAGKG
jgi:hypothetical protein